MQQVVLNVKPKSTFEVPLSDGYQVYSGILAMIQQNDENVSSQIHDTRVNLISISGLLGSFAHSERKGHKKILIHENYKILIGITDPVQDDVFRSFVIPIMLDNAEIPLEQGKIVTESISDRKETFDSILKQAIESHAASISFHFVTPTCIQFRNSSITEMFPNRIAVFHSLLSKWNTTSPDFSHLDISRDDFGRYLIERPDAKTYKTHSVLVNTIFDKKKEHQRPIFKQGFTCCCTYQIDRNAPEKIKNGILALAYFAPFCGVGSSVARGCGHVEVQCER